MIPAEALAQHIAVVGTVGSGKTYGAKSQIIEPLLEAGRRVCIIDPTGAHWGLRLLADGKTPGFNIAILGGEHGDIELHPDMGAKVAEMVGTRNMPCVLDLSEMLIGDRHSFMEDFAAGLYHHNRQALHLIIDEADEFCPQNPLPETRRMLHHVDRIVRRGRIRGFRVTMITQRPATISKNVLTQLNTLIAMRLTSPQDRNAIEAWVAGNADEKQAREVLGSLASLKRGTGWLWFPSGSVLEKTTFPSIRTFDSSKAPEEGDVAAEPIALAPGDLDALRAAVSDSQKQSDKKSDSNRQGKESQPSGMVEKINTPDVEAIREAFQNGYRAGREARDAEAYREGWAEGHKVGIGTAHAALKYLFENIDPDGIAAAFGDARGLIDAQGFAQENSGPEMPFTPPKASVSRETPSQDKRIPQTDGFTQGVKSGVKQANGSAGGAELRILRVLAARAPAKFTMAQWATLSGLKRSGGTWSTYVSRLRVAGYIEERNGLVGVTSAGLAVAGPVERPRGGSVVQQWKDALGSGPSKMIDALIRAHPHGMDRANLADRCGLTVNGGTFSTYLRLRSNGLAQDKGRRIFASETLFVDGN